MPRRQHYWLAYSVCVITLCGCEHSDGDVPASGVLKTEKISVDESPDPNVVDVRGVSKLLRAIDLGDEAQVRELLAAGAIPDDPRVARSTVIRALTNFHGGKLGCNAKILSALLEFGADPNRPDPMIGAVPLQTAFEFGDAECAEIIKAAGGTIKAHDQKGQTIVTAAVQGAFAIGDMAIVDLAISWGVNVNERNLRGTTPLYSAAWLDNIAIAKGLLDRGADPCLRDDYGQTALDVARNLRRSAELVNLLQSSKQCETR